MHLAEAGAVGADLDLTGEVRGGVAPRVVGQRDEAQVRARPGRHERVVLVEAAPLQTL